MIHIPVSGYASISVSFCPHIKQTKKGVSHGHGQSYCLITVSLMAGRTELVHDESYVILWLCFKHTTALLSPVISCLSSHEHVCVCLAQLIHTVQSFTLQCLYPSLLHGSLPWHEFLSKVHVPFLQAQLWYLMLICRSFRILVSTSHLAAGYWTKLQNYLCWQKSCS